MQLLHLDHTNFHGVWLSNIATPISWPEQLKIAYYGSAGMCTGILIVENVVEVIFKLCPWALLCA